MIVFMVILASFIALFAWREFALSGLRKAIDRTADALWALKLTIAEDRAAAAKERELAGAERDRAVDRDTRIASATRKERDLAGDERERQRIERGRLLERETDLLVTQKVERAEQGVERVKQDKERTDQGVERVDQGVERVEQRKERKRRTDERNGGG